MPQEPSTHLIIKLDVDEQEVEEEVEEELRKAYYQEQKISLVQKRGTIVTNPRERSSAPVSRRNAKISSSR
ncbi:hypothetical protein CCP3SC1AL1_1100001 [Gammaproteobacteria bacterium]